jgi:Flp pilus assembly protein TadD
MPEKLSRGEISQKAIRFKMQRVRSVLAWVVVPGIVLCMCAAAHADSKLRITIPKRSELTPVQRFNRAGVKAVRDHKYEKAEALFYKAYLYDPADPFTLNNLGYVSELEGQLDRAESFYKLAEEQGCDAVIAMSSSKQLVGKPMVYALGRLSNTPMRENRMNVEAINLLSHGRSFEAIAVLKKALAINPRNAFTLNNLGTAYESTGDFDSALRYYQAAAATSSQEPVVVTLNDSWRGRPISRAAAANVKALQTRMSDMNPVEVQANMLTLRGVSLANQNQWEAAQRDFMRAYALSPGDAFALNNRAYVAERQGDMETAQFYYSKARKAGDANSRVGLATDMSAEGQPLAAVASVSNQKVDNELGVYTRNQIGQPGPITLIPRGPSSDENKTSPDNGPNNPPPPQDFLKHPTPQ